MTPHYADDQVTLWCGDALDVLRTTADTSVDCVVTSPPYYGLRDYGEPGQYGLEETPAAYVETMRQVFSEVRRVLAKDGTLWLNLGDSYANDTKWGGASGGKHGEALHGETGIGRGKRSTALPPKSLIGIPWRVASRSRTTAGRCGRTSSGARTTPCRSQSRTGRPRPTSTCFCSPGPRATTSTLTRSGNLTPPRPSPLRPGRGSRTTRPGRRRTRRRGEWPRAGANPGDVWTFPTQPFPGAHFAVMPPALAERCILAGCRSGGTVLDPFCGSGTTGMVALRHGCRFVGIDLSAKYLDLALRTRLAQGALIEDTGVA